MERTDIESTVISCYDEHQKAIYRAICQMEGVVSAW